MLGLLSEEGEMIGPGKYDDQATKVMQATQASGVVLIIFNGDQGHGFSVQATVAVTLQLPRMLREIADQVEADLSTMEPGDWK